MQTLALQGVPGQPRVRQVPPIVLSLVEACFDGQFKISYQVPQPNSSNLRWMNLLNKGFTLLLQEMKIGIHLGCTWFFAFAFSKVWW